MTYVLSDIHGCYSEYTKMLEMIKFSDNDILYILGDVVDRGVEPIRCLLEIMSSKNIHLIVGNHENLMLEALTTSDTSDWFRNGGRVTLNDLLSLGKMFPEKADGVVDYITNLPYYFDINVNNRDFLLVHAGIRMSKNKNQMSVKEIVLNQYIDDITWIREEFYRRKGLPGHTIIFGHTPTFHMNHKSFDIWYDKRFKDKICIDGGCVFGGQLNCLRLDDMQEFIVKKKGDVY